MQLDSDSIIAASFGNGITVPLTMQGGVSIWMVSGKR